MRYLSLFDGISAAMVSWCKPWSPSLDWTFVARAEIEPFANAVAAHHAPNVPNLGDVSQITDEQIAALGPIDIVVGGSPCQDLSQAGLRAGLAGERSSLFHEQVRIFNAARHLCGARFLLWENVPGAFSSNGGADFAVVVGTLAGCVINVPEDGWGTEGVALGDHGLVEWCVLDAQWFGVAQRRRRIYALLDAGAWANRPPILLVPESRRGDMPARAAAGEDAPGYAETGAGSDRRSGVIDCTPAGITGTVSSKWAKGTGGPAGDEHYNLVVDGPVPSSEIAHEICANEQRTYTNEGSVFQLRNVVAQPMPFDEQQITHPENRSNPQPGDPSPTLTKNARPPSVATDMVVRRLTVVECSRLQGFPDDFCDVLYRGRPAADSPKYKALGNSFATPVVRWIGEQIEDALAHEKDR